MIRLVFALRRKPTLSRTEFQEYWLNKHAPLVASFATDLDILRYVQTHTLTDPANAAAQKARGDMEPEYDGVAELWWASEAPFKSESFIVVDAQRRKANASGAGSRYASQKTTRDST